MKQVTALNHTHVTQIIGTYAGAPVPSGQPPHALDIQIHLLILSCEK